MLKKNIFDKHDPMIEDILSITAKNTTTLQPAYVEAAKNAGQESAGLPLHQRKEVFKKHMRTASEACGQLLPANQYAEFDRVAMNSMNTPKGK